MTKYEVRAVSILVIIILVLLLALPGYPDTGFRPESPGETTFKLMIDPRLELISAVQSLTSWKDFLFTKLSSTYRDDQRRHFGRYTDHPAARWMEDKLDARAWPGNMIFLSPPPDMKIIHPFPEAMISHIGGQSEVERMVTLMNQFVKDTDFMKFWDAHREFYSALSENLENMHPFPAYKRRMDEFFGSRDVSLVLVLVPLFHKGGFSETLTEGKTRTIFAFCGPDSIRDGKPFWSEEYIRKLFFHEFGHGYTNPAVDAHWDKFEAHATLFIYLERDMRRKAYGTWRATCYEHVLRACEILLLREAGYAEEAEKNLEKCLADGFQLLPFLLEKLLGYTAAREPIETFEDYIPRLVEVFSEVEAIKTGSIPGSIGFLVKTGPEGSVVSTVFKGSDAEKAGLHEGDRLLSVDGLNAAAFTNDDLRCLKEKASPGDVWTISVMSSGKTKSIPIELPFIDQHTLRKKAKGP